MSAVAPARELVALGDSITVGEGQPVLGLACRSWAWWLAGALGLALANLAGEGATARDVRDEQLRRLRGGCALCCLYVGVNDARSPAFDPRAYGETLEELAAGAAARSDRLLMVTIPLDLGRPRAGESVLVANRAIRETAGRWRASVVALEGLRGWRLVLPDGVHLTALGQVELAERAARALALDGLAPARWPRDLADVRPGRRAGFDYAVRGHLPALARDLARRRREGTLLTRS